MRRSRFSRTFSAVTGIPDAASHAGNLYLERDRVTRRGGEADPTAPADESVAIESARLFTAYLQACRDEQYAMSLLPPGRFLLPGELAGSPALAAA